jgi:DNA polymerase V
MCIDLKSFYASVECVLRGLDPFEVNLVVADKERGGGSIVLAVSPHLKKFGVPSRCRIYELPTDMDIIYAKPRMKKYIEFSSRIYDIYLKYIAKEDIHVYSIDEAFMDFTSYMNYYNMPLSSIGRMILDDIFKTTGITATCGMGDNMFLAKVALDCLAKHSPDYMAYLNQELFYEKAWDIKPLSEIWGIGSRIEKRLNDMNIYCLRDLAHYSLPKLEKEFGIIGRELFEHAYGIDFSTVQEARSYKPQSRSFGYGQVLFEDYNYRDLYTILLEYVDELAIDLISRKLCCQMIGLGIGYSMAVGGGFYRQLTFPHKTNSKKILLEGFRKLYLDNIENLPIRGIQVRLGSLTHEDYVQTELFTDPEKAKKEHDLYAVLGEIQDRFGKNAVNTAISFTEKATKMKRNKLIGGHNAEY